MKDNKLVINDIKTVKVQAKSRILKAEWLFSHADLNEVYIQDRWTRAKEYLLSIKG